MAWRASSSFTYDWKYDVFLSFRGQDVRSGFAGDLYSALCEGGIRVYMDDEELRKGNELGPELFKAIEKSRIAIVVLSKNYAFSSFCLDELGTILERVNKNGRLVLPVFYYVDPSDVRHLKGSYGEAMTLHEEKFKEKKDKLNKWKMALHQAANLNGFSFNHGDGDKSKLVGRIIKEVSSRINRHPLYVANYPVGLESRILQVNSLLNVGSDDVVRMVGIYGIGGIGKTTIARAVYNSISDQFEGLCFLEDVRANSAKHGLAHLQQIVLSEIFVDQGIKLHDVNKGISLMRYRLSQKKVLLVIDDADKIEQLKAIVGGIDWFGPGSRVIITTRDKHLLAFHGVDCIYEVNGLSVEEALDLLTWHAFKTDEVETDAVDPSYADILDHVVTYASGLPLALEIIGSYFFGKSINEWKSLLDKYDKIPNEKIYNILKVSFDSLEEDEQMIFLDIACFFNGHKLANVIDILSAHHGLSVESIIEVLVEKSLIKIDDDLVTLHDLIQDMGKEIVRQESPMEPGKRSRLWFFEDVIHVLEENTGSSAIESLILDFPKSEVHSNGPECKEVRWDGEAFKKMQNLKTLVIRNCHFSKGPTHLPHSLRVLKWSGYPVPSLPLDFCPKKLVILELANSFLERSGQIQGFVQLGVLDFDYCEQITCIPDVSGLQNLEKLSFKHCENLIQIHDSVGFLPKLKLLNAVCCKLLRTFPPIRLTSLEQLDLSQCSNLESFPEILGKMENIKQLYLTGSPIKRLPLSIRNLTRLRKLEMEFCEMVQLPSSIVMLPELGLMSISRCEGLQLSELDKGEKMMSSNAKRVILS